MSEERNPDDPIDGLDNSLSESNERRQNTPEKDPGSPSKVNFSDILPNRPLTGREWSKFGNINGVLDHRPIYPNKYEKSLSEDKNVWSFLIEIEDIGWRGYHYVPADSGWFVTFTGEDYNTIRNMHEDYVLPHLQKLLKLKSEAEEKKKEILERANSTDNSEVDSELNKSSVRVENAFNGINTEDKNTTEISADEPEELIASVADDLEYMWQAESDVNLSDYGGRPSLCEMLQSDIVVPFRDQPEKADAFNIPIPSLLLHGPPGTGKTYLAEALAGELGYPYVALSGGDILSQWINASAEQIKVLFEEAEFMASNCGGAMIFIDEIDSVLNDRQAGNQHREDQKAVNEFLAHIDQPGENNILFVGATNIFNEIDSAAVSRFDRTLHVGLPDKETRKEIFFVQLRDLPIALSETHFDKLAAVTEGYTARDIRRIVTDASRYAAFKSDQDKITIDHCLHAVMQFSRSQ